MEISTGTWIGFIAFIVLLLIIDLKLVMRKPHKVTTREAAIYSTVWISMGLAFTGIIGWWYGGQAATEYITGFLIEKSLSIDNVFLWAIIFSYFKVPSKYQHEVLFWGIFGALVLRAIFIFAGVALLDTVEWIVYVFGALLLFTAYRLFTAKEATSNPEKNKIFRWVQKIIPHTDQYRGDKFFVTENGKRLATPLFIVLIFIEISDVLFAIDSIPAILAVTRNEFIVFTSNAFAILGLRALYFLLADLKGRFIYLDKGLALILAFVGIKFMIAEFIEIPILVSLGFIALVLAVSIYLSWGKIVET